ncbi:MAG: hypothetical protein ACJ8AK_02990 [Gemmatimonadaceae bacterium]
MEVSHGRPWFHSAKHTLGQIGQAASLAVIVGGIVAALFASLGYKVSGSGDAIAEIHKTDTVQDSSIARLQRQNEFITTRLDDIAYLVCEQTKRNQPRVILPRSCK